LCDLSHCVEDTQVDNNRHYDRAYLTTYPCMW